MLTEFQIKQIAAAALVLWARRAVNGPDDDADREFQLASPANHHGDGERVTCRRRQVHIKVEGLAEG